MGSSKYKARSQHTKRTELEFYVSKQVNRVLYNAARLAKAPDGVHLSTCIPAALFTLESSWRTPAHFSSYAVNKPSVSSCIRYQAVSSCASESALLTIVRVYKLYLLTYLLTYLLKRDFKEAGHSMMSDLRMFGALFDTNMEPGPLPLLYFSFSFRCLTLALCWSAKILWQCAGPKLMVICLNQGWIKTYSH